jgi:hypothetical protein
MKQLSPTARRLFELARGQDEPDDVARNRVARALSARIAAGVGLTMTSAALAKSAVGLGAIAAKSTLVVGVAGALVAASYLGWRTVRPADSPVASSHQPPLIARPLLALHQEDQPSAQPPPSVAGKESARLPIHRKPARPSVQPESSARPSAEAASDRLRAETEALRLAQQALRDKTPEQTLRLLDEQDVRFHDGQLRQERSAARILALCQLGRVEEARAQALGFERAWPHSALLGRVRSACWAR